MTADEFRASMARDASIRAPTTLGALKDWMTQKVAADAKRCDEAAYNFKLAQHQVEGSGAAVKYASAEDWAYLAWANAQVAAMTRTLPASALTPHHEARDPLRRYRTVL